MIKLEIGVCNICMSTKNLFPKIKKIAPNAVYKVGCQSYCGPGRKYPFVFLDNKPIVEATEKELLANLNKYLNEI